MRLKLLEAFRSHAKGHIDKHVANIEVYLNNPAGIGEHSDIIEAIDYTPDIIGFSVCDILSIHLIINSR